MWLLECEDPAIRSGIEATLADWIANYRPTSDCAAINGRTGF